MTTDAAVQERTRDGVWWQRLRVLLATVWLGLHATAYVLHGSPSDLATLYADVAAGRVERVELVGGLSASQTVPPGLRDGSAFLDVRWSAGGERRHAAVVEVAGSGRAASTSGREVTSDDVAARVRASGALVTVDQHPSRSGPTARLLGVELPAPASMVLLVAGLLTFALLVGGPEPWRATRWAWFWLLPVPFAVLALCLLSGPTPGLPEPREGRRLSGGWAFLIGSALGAGAVWGR